LIIQLDNSHRRHLLPFIVFTIYIFVVFNAFSQDDVFENKLAKIEQLDNKETVIEELDKLLKNKNLTHHLRFWLHQKIGDLYFTIGQYDKAITHANLTLSIAENHNLSDKKAVAYSDLGAYQTVTGNYDEALVLGKKALSHFKSIDTSLKQAETLDWMGSSHYYLNEPQDALRYYLLSASIFRQHDADKQLSWTLSNIANLYETFGDFEKAIIHFEEILKIEEKSENDNGIARRKGYLGELYFKQREYKLAESYLLDAIISFEGSDEHSLLSRYYFSLAKVYNSTNKPNEAIVYLQKSKMLASENMWFYSAILTEYAKALFHKGDILNAQSYLVQSNVVANENNNIDTLDENIALQSLFYAVGGTHNKAISFLISYQNNLKKNYNINLSSTLNDSLNLQLKNYESQQLTRQVSELTLNKKLLQVEKEQEMQFRNNIIISLVLLFIFGFFLYLRNRDQLLKKRLEKQVKQRTHELESANRKLEELSLLDGLTCVNNRRSFDRDLAKVWQESKQGLGTFSLLMADVDYFKLYNDTYGHVAGDDALKSIASVLKESIRDEDRVYRYGGEEFAIIFNNHDLNSINNTFTRIQNEINNLNIEHKESEFSVVTMSAGICAFNMSTESEDELIKQTDIHLYKAKDLGRNQLINTLVG
jgi:diguanylate cyclase (GGDEF)-like protein